MTASATTLRWESLTPGLRVSEVASWFGLGGELTLGKTSGAGAVDQNDQAVLKRLAVRNPLPGQPLLLIDEVLAETAILLNDLELPLRALRHEDHTATAIGAPARLLSGLHCDIPCRRSCAQDLRLGALDLLAELARCAGGRRSGEDAIAADDSVEKEREEVVTGCDYGDDVFSCSVGADAEVSAERGGCGFGEFAGTGYSELEAGVFSRAVDDGVGSRI